MGNAQIYYTNNLNSPSSYFEKVLNEKAAAFTDLTDTATFENPATFEHGTTSGEITYFGKSDKFSSVVLYQILTIIPSETNRIFEYWNGSAWTTLTFFRVDFVNTGWDTAALPFVFDQPTNWLQTIVNGSFYFWIRLRNTGVATGVVTTQACVNQTVICTNSELNFPAENIINDSIKGKTLRTNYESFEVLIAKNDSIDYIEDANTRVVTIPGGYYYPDELAAKVNETTSAFNVKLSYDKGTEKFTLAKSDGGTLTLNTATGSNKTKSLFQSLGFDCSANKTGALSYIADFPSKSTGGRFEITSSNDALVYNDGVDRTITLTNGFYNAKALCTELKTSMDTASAATNFDWQYDEYTGFFKTKRAAGTYILKMSHASTEIEDTLGWDAVGDITLTANVYSNAEFKRLHTSVDIYFCMPTRVNSANGPFVVANVNVKSPTLFVVQRLTGSSFTSTFLFETTTLPYRGYLIDTSADGTNTSVFRLSIANADNPSFLFIEAGYCFHGLKTIDLGSAPNLSGNAKEVTSFSNKTTTPTGYFRGTARNTSRGMIYPFIGITTLIKDSIVKTLFEEAVQDVGIFFFAEDVAIIPPASTADPKALLVRFGQSPKHQRVVLSADTERWNLALDLQEAI